MKRPGIAVGVRALFPETPEDRIFRSESITMPPSIATFLRTEADACGMAPSHFVLFLLAFYREHMEEVRALCQPWPVRYRDDKERVALPTATSGGRPCRHR